MRRAEQRGGGEGARIRLLDPLSIFLSSIELRAPIPGDSYLFPEIVRCDE